jgi:hypothetical protein
MGYANPDAVTQIANGLSTSTFSYDNNGNLTQKTTDGVRPCVYSWQPFSLASLVFGRRSFLAHRSVLRRSAANAFGANPIPSIAA